MSDWKALNDGTEVSVDKLQEGMLRHLVDTGAVNSIKAQVRREFIMKLREAKSTSNQVTKGSDRQPCATAKELIHGLLADYLKSHRLEHTLAVFTPESGHTANQMSSHALLSMLHIPPTQHQEMEAKLYKGASLLDILMDELLRRVNIHSMTSSTQTSVDIGDHRFALENQLRRVENIYLSKTSIDNQRPTLSIEERMLQYQQECDAQAKQMIQSELQRFRNVEIESVRREERKKVEHEIEEYRTSLLKEHQSKVVQLQDRERELDRCYQKKHADVESSLFSTRQSLFQEMETCRKKEDELRKKDEADSKHFENERKRMELWEARLDTQEHNIQAMIDKNVKVKEQEWQLEREKLLKDVDNRDVELTNREAEVSAEREALKRQTERWKHLQSEWEKLEATLLEAESNYRDAQLRASQVSQEKARLEDEVHDKKCQIETEQQLVYDLKVEVAHFQSENARLKEEVDRLMNESSDRSKQTQSSSAQIQSLQDEIVALKMAEGNAVVAERKRLIQLVEDERKQFRDKEEELYFKWRDAQDRATASEASMERYRSQYEDEHVRVKSLQQEVASLTTLLSQAQSSIHAKFGEWRDRPSSHRRHTSDRSDSVSERTLLLKMMEMMGTFGRDYRPVMRYEERHYPNQPMQYSQEIPYYRCEEDDRQARERREYQVYNGERRNVDKDMECRRHEDIRVQEQNHQEIKLFDEKQEKRAADHVVRNEAKIPVSQEPSNLESRQSLNIVTQKAPMPCGKDHIVNSTEMKLVDSKRKDDVNAVTEPSILDPKSELLYAIRDSEKKEVINGHKDNNNPIEDISTKPRGPEDTTSKVDDSTAKSNVQNPNIDVDQVHASVDVSVDKEVESEKAQDLESTQSKEDRFMVSADEENNNEKRIAQDEHQQVESIVQEILVNDEVNKDEETGIAQIENERSGKVNSMEDVDDHGYKPDAQEKSPDESVFDAPSSSEAIDIPGSDEDEAIAENKASDTVVDTSLPAEEVLTATEYSPEVISTKTPEELEAETRQNEEEAKKKEDEDVMAAYRQRVLERKAAEKQRLAEVEAQQQREKEEKERFEAEFQTQDDQSFADSDDAQELSGGSFAESSLAESSGSF